MFKYPFASFTTQRTSEGLWIIFPVSGTVRKLRVFGNIFFLLCVGAILLDIFLKLDVPLISNLIFGTWTQPVFILVILGTNILGTGWFKKSIIVTHYANELNALDDEPELQDIKTIPPRIRFYVTGKEAAEAQLFPDYLSIKNAKGEFVVGDEVSELDREKLLALLKEQGKELPPISKKTNDSYEIPEEDHTPLLERLAKQEATVQKEAPPSSQSKTFQQPLSDTGSIKPPSGSAIKVKKTSRGVTLHYQVGSKHSSFVNGYIGIGFFLFCCITLYQTSDDLELLRKLYHVIEKDQFWAHPRVEALIYKLAPPVTLGTVPLLFIPFLLWPKRKEKIHIYGLEIMIEKGDRSAGMFGRNPFAKSEKLHLLLSDLKNLNLSGDKITCFRQNNLKSFAEGLDEKDRRWIIDTLRANNKYAR